MKVELSNEEIKDIYKNLAGVVTHEALVIQELEMQNKTDSIEDYEKAKEDSARRLDLIIRLSKLIDW